MTAIIYIPFNQSDLIEKLDATRHATLLKFVKKYDGLCDLICNRLLIDNYLGTGTNPNSLINRVTITRLDENKIKKSHILNVYSVFRRIIAFLFGIYPDNIFKPSDQWKLVRVQGHKKDKVLAVNRDLLACGLRGVDDGETLKLEVFSKSFLSLTGHSLLIKKICLDDYIFFDPNIGEERDLTYTELCNKIDQQLLIWQGTDIFLIKGQTFLNKLKA